MSLCSLRCWVGTRNQDITTYKENYIHLPNFIPFLLYKLDKLNSEGMQLEAVLVYYN